MFRARIVTNVFRKKKQNTIAKRIVLTVLGILFVLMVATGIFAVTYVRSNLNAMDVKSTEFVTVEIPAGSSNREIGTILEKKAWLRMVSSSTITPSLRIMETSNPVISIYKRVWI